MAKQHGPKQQKRVAKQKAKRAAKRTMLVRRTSNDPTIRLQRAGDWPVVESLVAESLWDQGIGSLVIARESAGRLILGVFLVDVFCLGVKSAFWHAGTRQDFQKLIEKMETTEAMRAIAPACLVKIVKGGVEYAKSFGFAPDPDYRHASLLLEGIDPATCPNEYTFGRDGKPFYFQGPNESPAQAAAIMQRIQALGGHFVVGGPNSPVMDLAGFEDDLDAIEDDSADESF